MDNHIHKYERVKLGKNGFVVFRCVQRGCAHYIRKELVVGNKTICWRCGKEIVMTKKLATLKKPHCDDCTREPHGKAAQWAKGDAA